MTEQPPSPSRKAKRDEEPGGRKSLFARFLAFVEWLGNLLPHPVTLFALIAILTSRSTTPVPPARRGVIRAA
jgi:p-aminobenzoyl-glutamate transporter AbgT